MGIMQCFCAAPAAEDSFLAAPPGHPAAPAPHKPADHGRDGGGGGGGKCAAKGTEPSDSMSGHTSGSSSSATTPSYAPGPPANIASLFTTPSGHFNLSPVSLDAPPPGPWLDAPGAGPPPGALRGGAQGGGGGGGGAGAPRGGAAPGSSGPRAAGDAAGRPSTVQLFSTTSASSITPPIQRGGRAAKRRAADTGEPASQQGSCSTASSGLLSFLRPPPPPMPRGAAGGSTPATAPTPGTAMGGGAAGSAPPTPPVFDEQGRGRGVWASSTTSTPWWSISMGHSGLTPGPSRGTTPLPPHPHPHPHPHAGPGPRPDAAPPGASSGSILGAPPCTPPEARSTWSAAIMRTLGGGSTLGRDTSVVLYTERRPPRHTRRVGQVWWTKLKVWATGGQGSASAGACGAPDPWVGSEPAHDASARSGAYGVGVGVGGGAQQQGRSSAGGSRQHSARGASAGRQHPLGGAGQHPPAPGATPVLECVPEDHTQYSWGDGAAGEEWECGEREGDLGGEEVGPGGAGSAHNSASSNHQCPAAPALSGAGGYTPRSVGRAASGELAGFMGGTSASEGHCSGGGKAGGSGGGGGGPPSLRRCDTAHTTTTAHLEDVCFDSMDDMDDVHDLDEQQLDEHVRSSRRQQHEHHHHHRRRHEDDTLDDHDPDGDEDFYTSSYRSACSSPCSSFSVDGSVRGGGAVLLYADEERSVTPTTAAAAAAAVNPLSPPPPPLAATFHTPTPSTVPSPAVSAAVGGAVAAPASRKRLTLPAERAPSEEPAGASLLALHASPSPMLTRPRPRRATSSALHDDLASPTAPGAHRAAPGGARPGPWDSARAAMLAGRSYRDGLPVPSRTLASTTPARSRAVRQSDPGRCRDLGPHHPTSGPAELPARAALASPLPLAFRSGTLAGPGGLHHVAEEGAGGGTMAAYGAAAVYSNGLFADGQDEHGQAHGHGHLTPPASGQGLGAASPLVTSGRLRAAPHKSKSVKEISFAPEAQVISGDGGAGGWVASDSPPARQRRPAAAAKSKSVQERVSRQESQGGGEGAAAPPPPPPKQQRSLDARLHDAQHAAHGGAGQAGAQHAQHARQQPSPQRSTSRKQLAGAASLRRQASRPGAGAGAGAGPAVARPCPEEFCIPGALGS